MSRARETRQHFYHSLRHTHVFGMQVLGCGCCERDFRRAQPIEKRDFHCFAAIHLTRGEAFYETEATPRIRCGVGDTLLLVPGLRHSYGVLADADFEEIWTMFDGPAIKLLFKGKALRRDRTFFPGLAGNGLTELFEQAYAQAEVATVAAQRRLPGLLLSILTELIPVGDHDLSGQAWTAKAQGVLAERATERVDLEALAEQFKVSYSSFRSRFKQATGVAPGAYHLAQKMNAACALLMQGTSVAETAAAVGIADPFYFSRLFKKHTGIPPSSYGR